jgi:glycoside/pentoside/hexuronide:cation symporter, GPH family
MFKFLGASNRKLNQDYVIAKADKVPALQKFGFGLGSIHDMWGHWLYTGLAFMVFNVQLGVSPKWISRALLFKLVFEAVWDSVFGWWSDNTRTRFGRRRPFILVGSILSGLCLPLLFMVQPGWTETQYFWFIVASFAVYVPIMSCFYMPFQSLGAELTPDYHERTNVGAVRSAMQKVPEVAMFAAAAFATAGVWVGATVENAPERLLILARQTTTWFGDVFASLFTFDFARIGVLMKTLFGWVPSAPDAKPNILLGAQSYFVVLGSIMVVAGIVMFFLIRERYYDKVVLRQTEKISIKETLWQTLSCRPFRANLSMALAYGIGTSMVGTLGLYATLYYVCKGDVAAGGTWNFWMGLSGMVLGLCGIPVYAFAARRLGKRHAMIFVQLSAIAVFVGTWWLYNPAIQWLQIFASGLIAFTSAGFWMLYGSITADIIDYDELETGKRREGSFSACGSWIMKVGMGLGNWASGEILDATGFDASLGGNQTDHAIFMIRFLLAAIPVAGLVVALILLTRLGLSQQNIMDIRTQLEARRGKV